MGSAIGWGALAASSLVLGALLALGRRWPEQAVGAVLAFGAGALISAVSFELAEEGAQVGGPGFVALGLAAGALVYFFADGIVERPAPRTPGRRRTAAASDAGRALALGAFLDGIPEQAVLGIGLAEGNGVSVGLLVAIFVSNLPEAIGSASEMRGMGTTRRAILRLWGAVAVICVAACAAGYAVAEASGGDLKAAINGFAAGALIVMLVDSMIPDATSKFGRRAGLVTTLGFAVAAALSGVGQG
jgi:zinc transporter, ZIP family